MPRANRYFLPGYVWRITHHRFFLEGPSNGQKAASKVLNDAFYACLELINQAVGWVQPDNRASTIETTLPIPTWVGLFVTPLVSPPCYATGSRTIETTGTLELLERIRFLVSEAIERLELSEFTDPMPNVGPA